ncbi:MAG: hypothetical protein C4520_18285 [Candidatus Abyssobacteria bacterium SURF_5]|uniref:Uncharacterized protein n=1 Tax=Abyssobacteria bacterium (strain SURF_5) TaxID=2093360 RepID=A0A3A4NMP2_ABYX5|nr:MAG: hypothetical protein C4520_18285 [Candidatus Abyssubacteria bacterium SURF_5]
MIAKRFLMLLIGVSFIIQSLFTSAWAEEAQLPLKADKAHRDAAGILSLDQDSIPVKAEGLRPDSVYTVWFVSMGLVKREAGAGEAPYMFKTNSEGEGTYSSSLDESPFGEWDMVMIVLHPDDDPTNMKNMVGALSADLPKES